MRKYCAGFEIFEENFPFICIFAKRKKYNRSMNSKQYTFSEFTKKAVINVCDGRELGHVCDLIFNNCGGINAIVVPGKKSLFKSLTSSENLIIPFNRIVRIGSDVILTDVVGNMASACAAPPRSQTAYSQATPQTNYAPPQQAAYSAQYQPAADEEYTAQAYSIPAEPMYRAEQSDARPQGEQSSAQTYYHAE